MKGRPTSLLDLGYVNVGLDDGWQACGGGSVNSSFHDADGTPLVDGVAFPALGDMVRRAHRMGLRAGFYLNNCVCPELCLEAAKEAEAMEATAAAVVALGFDAVKVDSCSQFKNLSRWRQLLGPAMVVELCFQGGIQPGRGPTMMSALIPKVPNLHVSEALAACDHPLQPGGSCPYQVYRVSADIAATWPSILANLENLHRALTERRGFSRPGLWACTAHGTLEPRPDVLLLP